MNLIASALSFLISMHIFLRTTTGAFFPDDTPWTMSAVFDLEHQHPPGYPLYTLLSRLWVVIPIGGPSFRLNLLSAVLMSLTGVLVGLLASEITRRSFNPGPRTRALFLVSSSLIFSLSWTGWEQALSFKGGVYALNTIIMLGIIGLSSGLFASSLNSSRLIAVLSLLIGLGLSHHWMTLLVNIPLAILPFIWWRRGSFSPGRMALYGAAFLLLGVSTYLLLPIRSGNAYVNWGEPDALGGFIKVITRAQYRSEERINPAPGYWSQKAEYVSGFFVREWTLPGLMLGFVGLIASLALLPRESLIIFLCAIFTAFSVFWYDLKPPDCFFSRAHFYLPTIAIWSLFISLSLIPLWLMAGNRSRYFLAFVWLTAISFQLSAKNRVESHDLSHAYVPYDYSKNILDCTPRNAFLLCEGEGDWFPCLYQVRVEHYRTDVDPLNYYLMRIGFRPFLKAYCHKYPGLVSRVGAGYSMNPRPDRPIAASIEMDDPSFPGNASLSGLVRYAPGFSPARAKKMLSRLRHRGLYDVAKLTEMYSTYARTASLLNNSR